MDFLLSIRTQKSETNEEFQSNEPNKALQRSRLLVTDAATQPPRQAIVSLNFTLGRKTMNWTSIIEGTAAGVAGSMVLGASAYLYTTIRDRRLRDALKSTLTRFSTGHSAFGVSIGLSNHTSRCVTIRSVSLSGKKARYRLNPEGTTSTLSIDRNAKLTEKQKKELEAGKMVEISQEIGFTHSWREKPPVSGFIEILPYTSHDFLLPAELLVDYDDELNGVLIIAEYVSWSGSVELIEGKVSEGVDNLNRSIIHYVDQIKSGSLNKGRAVFGIPPLKIPEKKKWGRAKGVRPLFVSF